jgi:uncharacterized membrane protein YhhN
VDTTEILLIAAGALALGDWVAVALRIRRVEYLLKPATLAALVAAAALSHLDSDVKPWVIAALALGLVGDIALMLAGNDADDAVDAAFLGGLGAFLLGHAAYIVAFLRFGVQGWETLGGALFAVGVGGIALPAAIRGAARTAGREIALLVAAYAVVIAVMAAGAAGTTLSLTAIGGGLFVVSDAVLARERFVGRVERGRVALGELAVVVTYHLAQALILIGLLPYAWAHHF